MSDLFGPSENWADQDLIGLSEYISPAMTLEAYASGFFPMPVSDGKRPYMGWWSPMRRGVIELGALRVSRSLRKSVNRYTTTIDRAFEQVILQCADRSRPDGWIDGAIREVYTALHQAGYVHSIETWDQEGRLVGGLYGVSLRGLFAGESMFHDPVHGRDASKVALVRLVAELRSQPGNVLLDVQWLTTHLASLGATEITRKQYLNLLWQAMQEPDMVWQGGRQQGEW